MITKGDGIRSFLEAVRLHRVARHAEAQAVTEAAKAHREFERIRKSMVGTKVRIEGREAMIEVAYDLGADIRFLDTYSKMFAKWERLEES